MKQDVILAPFYRRDKGAPLELRIPAHGNKKSSDASYRPRNLRVEVSAYEPGTLSIAPRRC